MILTSTIYNSFADNIVWSYMIQVFILVGALLIGNVIRRKIPFIRRSLMPTSLIGGLIILIIKFIPEVNDFIDEGCKYREMTDYFFCGQLASKSFRQKFVSSIGALNILQIM